MKKLIIIGAGDFGREALWLAERINEKFPTYHILGFVDDEKIGETVSGYPVLGSVDWLCKYSAPVSTVCAIANGDVKASIFRAIEKNPQITQVTLIDPTAIIGVTCKIGAGSIVCAGVVMTVDVAIGNGCIVNLNCTLGHDTVLRDFCTLHPGCNVSGKVTIGERVLIGTGSRIIQGISVASNTIIGAGAVVIRDITESGTYVGVPAVRKCEDSLCNNCGNNSGVL